MLVWTVDCAGKIIMALEMHVDCSTTNVIDCHKLLQTATA